MMQLFGNFYLINIASAYNKLFVCSANLFYVSTCQLAYDFTVFNFYWQMGTCEFLTQL